MPEPLTVLGIETSCDETAVAVVTGGAGRPVIRANLVQSQLAEHAPYGGVVPEIAARAHLDHLDRLIGAALAEAEMGFGELDGVAAAAGPGLIGGLIVGTMAAKGIAWAARKPFVAVNHLEAHALTARLSDEVAFPYLLLLVSGGHSQLLVCAGVGAYRQLGTTLDDAAGEAFDKSAKLLGLPQPGGPAIEQAARGGNARRFSLPRPLKGREGCDFSFSGLKTAIRERIAAADPTDPTTVADLAAAIELAICDALIDRTAQRGALVPPPSSAGHQPRRRRRGRGQCAAARSPRGAGRGCRAGFRRAAAGAVHRQRRDDRLGRDRAAALRARATRSTRRCGRAGRSTRKQKLR